MALSEKLEKAIQGHPERALALEWMFDEWNAYATGKFGPPANRKAFDRWMEEQGWDPHGDWIRQITQYAGRAHIYMVHGNPAEGELDGNDDLMLLGKQAAMKMGTTLVDGLATMIRIFGLPPGPGPSGDIKEWER